MNVNELKDSDLQPFVAPAQICGMENVILNCNPDD